MTTTETTTTLTEDQQAYVDGLRDLAAFLAARPDLIPYGGRVGDSFMRFVPEGLDTEPDGKVRAEVARLARQLGTAEKSATGSFFNLSRMFGPHTFQVTATREQVCERVVVGTETVEVPDPDAVAALPKVQREVEKVEWVCPPSILAAGEKGSSK